jgi:S1-C subfamily serine protease
VGKENLLNQIYDMNILSSKGKPDTEGAVLARGTLGGDASAKLLHEGLAGTTVDASVAAQLRLPVTQGVLITSVVANGPAAQAGLKAGDVIVRLNERAVTDVAALLDNVLNKRSGEQVTLQIYRGTQLATVNVTLGTLHVP